MGKKKLFIIPNQHMDLVWRRCFDRDIQYGGQNFVSYADIEEIYIKDSVALCEKYPFYHFTVESVAVLRSPTNPTCLHAGADYNMPLFDGMRDSGDHHFTYALKSYGCALADSDVHADGMGFNGALVISQEMPDLSALPRLQGENCWISAVIPSLDRKGLILRVAEYRGKTGSFRIELPECIKAVYETDLKADVIAEIPLPGHSTEGTIRPFEIKTFYLAI